MKNLSKYITLNLLSILGYVFLVFFLVVEFYLFPEMKEYARISDNDFNPFVEELILVTSVSLITALIEFFLVAIVFPIEIFIYKFRKTNPQIIKIPEKLGKIHLIAFIFGILLSMIPMVISAYLLFY